MKKIINAILKLFLNLLILLILVNVISTLSLKLSNSDEKDASIRINDATINYKKYGTSGPPILLIHGFFDSSKTFDSLAQLLSKDHIVISIDLIGCGLSNKSPALNYSKDNEAKLCNHLMNNLGYKKYSIVGHSDGTDISLKLASSYPNNLDNLILLNEYNNTFAKDLYAPMFFTQYLDLNYESQIVQSLNSLSNKEAFDLNLLEYNLKNNLSLTSETYSALLKSRDEAINFDQLKNIKTKTLILWGSDDKNSPVDTAYKLNKTIPSSSISIIENCGSYPQIEATSLIHKEVSDFLNY